MKKLYFVIGTVALINLHLAINKGICAPIRLEQSSDYETRWPFLLSNLEKYFRMESSTIPDSNTYTGIIEKFSEAISIIDDMNSDGDWVISHRYWLKSVPEFIFIEVSDGNRIDGAPFDVCFDIIKNKVYLLNYAQKEEINEIIPPSKFKLDFNSEILDYCRLFALLNNSAKSVRFISSIEEILMEAVYSEPSFYNLDKVKEYANVEIEMPSISGLSKTLEGELRFLKEDTAKVSFYMARENKIINVRMSLIRRRVIEYVERLVGETLFWNKVWIK